MASFVCRIILVEGDPKVMIARGFMIAHLLKQNGRTGWRPRPRGRPVIAARLGGSEDWSSDGISTDIRDIGVGLAREADGRQHLSSSLAGFSDKRFAAAVFFVTGTPVVHKITPRQVFGFPHSKNDLDARDSTRADSARIFVFFV